VASRLGLDSADAEAALRDRTYRPRVEADLASGTAAGATGTPTFFIDGERLSGHWRQLGQIIPAALEAQ
jgi:protein-disulfide isomerase